VTTIRPLWRIPGILVRERLYSAQRLRIPEPMVMDDAESVAQFHTGGAANPGMRCCPPAGDCWTLVWDRAAP
jgi:hypothetical protein